MLDGQWALESIVGQGGMSIVYQARHRDGGQAAIKILHTHLAESPGSRARFLAEQHASRRIRHEGVVEVLRGGESEGVPYLVMELLEGESLAERLRAGRVEVLEAIAVAVSVLEIVARAHDAGVVHRDLKPANIFLTADGKVKVLDFGIAKMPHDSTGYLTGDGAVLGTPEFMPPEQAGGSDREIDARTDIFAVGATIFYCLSGRPIHQARSSNEALVAAATRAVISLSEAVPDAPDALVAIVDRALSFDAEQRWPNARAMARALLATLPASERASLGALDTSPTVPETAPTASLRPRRARPVPASRIALVGVLAALPAAGLLAATLSARPPAPPLSPPIAPASLSAIALAPPVTDPAPLAAPSIATPQASSAQPVATQTSSARAASAPVAAVTAAVAEPATARPASGRGALASSTGARPSAAPAPRGPSAPGADGAPGAPPTTALAPPRREPDPSAPLSLDDPRLESFR